MASCASRPVFFLVGAGKAGTSSLFHDLRAHPEVHVHPGKDVACFFCDSYGTARSFDAYARELFPPGDYRIAGDVCHAYLSSPESAERIANTFAAARIVVVVRNPVDRAHSLYQWMAHEGYEYAPTFEQALRVESRRTRRGLNRSPALVHPFKPNYCYFGSGLYAPQIARYVDRFARDRILFLRFDDYLADPDRLHQRLFEFLGVSSDFRPPRVHSNPAAAARSVPLQYALRQGLRVLPQRWVDAVMGWNRAPASRSLRADTARRLLDRYRSDIEHTAELTGLDLRPWLENSR